MIDIKNEIIQGFFKQGIDLTQLEVCEWKIYKKEYSGTYFKVGNLKIKQVEIDNESPIRTYVYYILVKEEWEQFGYVENGRDIIFEYWT